ncbi:hypothetical protein [Paenibacillus macerans]|uniref:magnesium chelatase subunit ChlI family protein n=1 Tax=Paenibacillus macerans TaxID=44252 RepID=UPI00203FEDE3|nr:hypothetical protein [Paenibacillus macerans]MCM3699255.1 hypothetical protein [Paenibacillus macerans]
MHIEVPRPNGWLEDKRPLSSEEMRRQVLKAMQIQTKRYKNYKISRNSELSGSLLRRFAPLAPEAGKLLQSSFEALGLSMRAHDRTLKLARTIADLEGQQAIQTEHIAEAIQYRQLDRRLLDVRG